MLQNEIADLQAKLTEAERKLGAAEDELKVAENLAEARLGQMKIDQKRYLEAERKLEAIYATEPIYQRFEPISKEWFEVENGTDYRDYQFRELIPKPTKEIEGGLK
jgi:chemotaxis regulatin CheY-phosphate phosphatase CheZ